MFLKHGAPTKRVSWRLNGWAAALAFSLVTACGVTDETEMGGEAGLFTLSEDTNGTVIPNEEAHAHMGLYCGDASRPFLEQMNHGAFHTGYKRHEDGSAVSFDVHTVPGENGEDLLLRNGREQMRSTNGMGMWAGSKDTNYADEFRYNCFVNSQALQGQNFYKQVEATFGGTRKIHVAGKQFNLNDCLTLKMKADTTNATRSVSYCGANSPDGKLAYVDRGEVRGPVHSAQRYILYN